MGAKDPTVTFYLDQRDYFRLLFILTACFGFILNIPWLIVLLVRLRLLKPQTIAKNRRYVILGRDYFGCGSVAADPVSQIMLFLPMLILFEIGLLVSRRTYRRAQQSAEVET